MSSCCMTDKNVGAFNNETFSHSRTKLPSGCIGPKPYKKFTFHTSHLLQLAGEERGDIILTPSAASHTDLCVHICAKPYLLAE